MKILGTKKKKKSRDQNKKSAKNIRTQIVFTHLTKKCKENP